jgi:hypothetical protein
MAAQRERLIESGFVVQDLVHMRRPVKTPDRERQVAYTILRVEPGEMPEGRVQMLTNHTPDLLWTPGSTAHDNRVDALTDLLICVEDQKEAANRYCRYTGRETKHDRGIDIVALDRGKLLFADPDTMETIFRLPSPDLPYIAGLALRSADLDATRRLLAGRGVRPVYENAEVICVGPGDGLGAFLLFHAATVEAPWRALAAR